MLNCAKIKEAIAKSGEMDCCVEVNAARHSIEAVADELGYDYDGAGYQDGSVDIWGHTNETVTSGKDWHLRIV